MKLVNWIWAANRFILTNQAISFFLESPMPLEHFVINSLHYNHVFRRHCYCFRMTSLAWLRSESNTLEVLSCATCMLSKNCEQGKTTLSKLINSLAAVLDSYIKHWVLLFFSLFYHHLCLILNHSNQMITCSLKIKKLLGAFYFSQFSYSLQLWHCVLLVASSLIRGELNNRELINVLAIWEFW